MATAPHHVFTKAGDACAEVDDALRALAARGVTREASGYVKCMPGTRAAQAAGMGAPRGAGAGGAAALRARAARGVTREASGYVKCMHVTRAEQTVVMVTTRDAPL